MTQSLRKPLHHLNLSLLSLLSLLPWLALLAWLASVAWFLTDDAFISFRYTRNLLEGHGLVFNPGERVEGYTNFLWILELAAIWALFSIPPEAAAPWLSVAYTIATLFVTLWWTIRLPALHDRPLVAWLTLGLICSSATFAVWTSSGGLETRQFSFFIVAAVVCLSLYPNSHRGLISTSLALAAAELTRPEALLLAACCFAWFTLQRLTKDKSINTRLVKDIAYLVAPFALIVAAHFLFRYAYYGEWLPNTYYAKHVRPWYESGFRYLAAATIETGLYLLLPLAYFALRSRWQSHRDSIYALSLLCVLAHMAYLLPIGGDHFEYRPLDFYWPLLALPAAEAIALHGAKAATGLPKLLRSHFWINKRGILTIVFFIPILFYASSIQATLLFEGAKIREHFSHSQIELDKENTGWLLAAPGMPALAAVSNDLRRQSGAHWVAMRFAVHRNIANTILALTWKPYEEMERGFIPDDALESSTGLGKYYYMPDLKVIDAHGLTDATVARTSVTRPNVLRVIGHDRQPTPEYLKQRGVNIQIYSPASNAIAALNRANFAVEIHSNLWMPFDSTSAQWALNSFADRELLARGTFSTVQPARNFFRVFEQTNSEHSYVGERFLGHFESGFDGWLLSGEAVTNFNQHANFAGQPLIWNRADDGFLTSYHPSRGNRTTGRALSPTFAASADQYLAFLIAGGGGQRVGLRLLADGEEAAVWRGRNTERFHLVIHPLGYVSGKTLQLELFDRELGEWGHIMLDHVMLAACDLCPQEPIALAQLLNAQSSDDNNVYLIPARHNRSDVRTNLLSHKMPPFYTFNMDAPDLAQEVEFALTALKNLSTVRVVEWNSTNPWIDNNARPLNFLLTKYGRFLGSYDYEDFTVHNYANISFEHPWIYHEYLEPLTINFDGGIALLGLALGHGPEQLPAGQLLDLGPERSLWSVLRWRTESALEVDYAISLRLYNAGDERTHQEDTVLWNPIHLPTSHWLADEPVETTALLRLPTDIPPGDYELRMVVYDFETQLPTVQIDVWEPEITLARLRLAEIR